MKGLSGEPPWLKSTGGDTVRHRDQKRLKKPTLGPVFSEGRAVRPRAGSRRSLPLSINDCKMSVTGPH